MTTTANDQLEGLGTYKFGWADPDVAGASARRGLSEDVVRDISRLKNEPEWMLEMRLKGLKYFQRKPMPNWGSDLSGIDFDNIKYFVRSTEKQAASWDEHSPKVCRDIVNPGGVPSRKVETHKSVPVFLIGARVYVAHRRVGLPTGFDRMRRNPLRRHAVQPEGPGRAERIHRNTEDHVVGDDERIAVGAALDIHGLVTNQREERIARIDVTLDMV